MRDIGIITLDPRGEAHPLALVDEDDKIINVVVVGDPPARFVHANRAWHATGKVLQPPACPPSYEYRPSEELS